MARYRAYTRLIVVLFLTIHLAISGQSSGFLKETHLSESAAEEQSHEASGESSGEEGIEFHYAYGTKGFYVCILISICLTLFAGLMSGLTVGLLSIDTLELEMKMIHGTDEQKKLASEVLPLLKRHHYLLVTLLLCNAFAMEALPIFLDAIVPAVWAIIISVTAVLFFGEIIPQAVCTGPQQLKIASLVAPSVTFLMIAVGIVAYPISKILDCLLGEHHPIRYTNNDLKALIELHSYKALTETLDHPALTGFGLQGFQTKMIQGAIDIQNNKIVDDMIPFDDVFSISIDRKINHKSAKKILENGFSRIPVFINKDRHAIIGYLLIKSLVGVDLSEGRTIKELMDKNIVKIRRPLYVGPHEAIGGLLSRFKNGKSHMAIVTDDIKLMEKNMKNYLSLGSDRNVVDIDEPEANKAKTAKVLGIITLEDIIESALKEEILDEADYDLENDVNVGFSKLDKSMEGQSMMGDKHEKLHEAIKETMVKNLTRGRKHSDIFGKGSHTPSNWVEMNELNENLLKNDNSTNNAELPSNKGDKMKILLDKQGFSKSYSTLQVRKKI